MYPLIWGKMIHKGLMILSLDNKIVNKILITFAIMFKFVRYYYFFMSTKFKVTCSDLWNYLLLTTTLRNFNAFSPIFILYKN